MKITKWQQIDKHPNPHGVDVRKIYDAVHAQVMHITLNPGEKLKRHITPVDVIFYVLEGQGIVEIGDEKREVEQGTLIDSPRKIPHCWYNEGDKILRFLVIKIPRPSEKSKLL